MYTLRPSSQIVEWDDVHEVDCWLWIRDIMMVIMQDAKNDEWLGWV